MYLYFLVNIGGVFFGVCFLTQRVDLLVIEIPCLLCLSHFWFFNTFVFRSNFMNLTSSLSGCVNVDFVWYHEE